MDLAAHLRNKLEEAKELRGRFQNSTADGIKWGDYWKGREDGLVEIINTLDDAESAPQAQEHSNATPVSIKFHDS